MEPNRKAIGRTARQAAQRAGLAHPSKKIARYRDLKEEATQVHALRRAEVASVGITRHPGGRITLDGHIPDRSVIRRFIEGQALLARAARASRRLRRVIKQHHEAHGEDPTVEVAAEIMKVPAQKVAALLIAWGPPLPIDQEIEFEDGEAGTLHDFIADDRDIDVLLDPLIDFHKDVRGEQLRTLLRQEWRAQIPVLLAGLTKLERYAVTGEGRNKGALWAARRRAIGKIRREIERRGWQEPSWPSRPTTAPSRWIGPRAPLVPGGSR